MLKFIIVLVVIAMPALAEARGTRDNSNTATFQNCKAAVSTAKANNNEWQAKFSIDECQAIMQKIIDAGEVLMDPKYNGGMLEEIN